MYNSPTHISEFAEKFIGTELALINKEYGDYISVFQINQPIKSLMGKWNSKDECFANNVIANFHDESSIQIYDSTIHGYNGKFGIIETEAPDEQKTISEFAIETNTKLIIAFQYGGDEKEYAEENNDENPQDYFDWIIIYSINEMGLNKLIEFECA